MHWLFYIIMQVLLDTTALEQEKRQLEMENEKLRLLLKQYLDGNVARAMVLSMANFAFSWSCGCMDLLQSSFSLTGISVSEEILSQKNPLLIVSSTERPSR